MGDGSTSSIHNDPEQPHTLAEQVTYWQDRAMQYKSERDQVGKTCEKLALKLGEAERELAEYKQTFPGFHFQTPKAADQEEPEPFSQ